jgi:hypothetical protein
MAKYYVKYRNKMLITSQKTPENAAVCLLRVLRSVCISASEYIYVDERGFRTDTAQNKYDIFKIMNHVIREIND